MCASGMVGDWMKRIAPEGRPIRGVVGWLWAISLLAALVATPVTAVAAERVVLGEEFSATW